MTTRTYQLVGDNQVAINITQFIIAIGVTLTCFACFALLRSFFFQSPASIAAQEITPPAGLYERSQQPEAIPTPRVAITPMPEGMTEYPVPVATEATWSAQSEMDALWAQRNNGQSPQIDTLPGCTADIDNAGNIIPGTEHCWGGHQIIPSTYSAPATTGFSTGNGASVNRTDIGQKSGYYTTNGLSNAAATQ